jgi:hypothetical protein
MNVLGDMGSHCFGVFTIEMGSLSMKTDASVGLELDPFTAYT